MRLEAGPLPEFWQEPARFERFSHNLGVIKSKKAGTKPFPKRGGVGTYRPHPIGIGPGLPSQEALRDGSGAADRVASPFREKLSPKARNGLSRGGAAR